MESGQAATGSTGAPSKRESCRLVVTVIGSAGHVRIDAAGLRSKGEPLADRVLFIGWSTPVRGREERGLEVFNESIGLYGRMQQEGRIEKFDVVLLGPTGDLNGYIELHGSAEQLAALRENEEFQRNTIDASLIVDGLRQIEGITNEEIARQLALYRDSLAAFRRPPEAT